MFFFNFMESKVCFKVILKYVKETQKSGKEVQRLIIKKEMEQKVCVCESEREKEY